MAKFMLDGQEYCGGGGSNQIVKLTQAEYDALSDEKLSNNTIYLITDSGELTAENLFYDGSVTGLGNNVQDAIDGVNNKVSENKFRIEYEYIVTELTSTPFSTSHTITEDGLYYISFQLQKYSASDSNEYIEISNGFRHGMNSTSSVVNPHISAFVNLKKNDIVTVGSTVGTSYVAGTYQSMVQIVKI